jgi:zinc protease
MNAHRTLAALAGLALGIAGLMPAAALAADGAIVAHPDQLQFPAQNYEPPKAAAHRVKLKNGMVAYLAPDRTLPLVTVTVLMRVGQDLDPAGKEGLASLAMHLVTRSGTPTKTAQQLEDRVAFLGAEMNSGLGGGGGGFFGGGLPLGNSEATASINLLAKDLDEGLALLAECLKSPAWEAERLKLRKEQLLQSMKERNDQSTDIETREWGFLTRGEGHWSNRYPTQASVDGITAEDLTAFHKRYVGPKNFIFAVSGDFDRGAMTQKLDKAFANWPQPGERPAAPAAPTAANPAGWNFVDKDVNQGRVSIGLAAIDRYDPDYQACRVMNDILGGGSFTSRLVNRIRSDEGLAYSVRSAFEGGTYYPEPLRIMYQSKVRSVAYATEVALNEVKRMRDEPVSETELATAKNKFIESLPTVFDNASAIAGVLATEELTGRYAKDPNYFTEYRARVGKVTVADVQRVAKRLLDPATTTTLMVGDVDEMMLGDGKHDARITGLAGGEPKRIPLRDPMTMKPMATP